MTQTWMYVAFGLLLLFLISSHVRGMKKKEAAARAAAERGKLFSGGPRA